MFRQLLHNLDNLLVFSCSNRYKEELVSQLVKSEKEAKEMKIQYNEKIKRMKLEVEKAKKDLEETKKALDEVESKANFEISEKQKLENEYKKKLNSVEAKLQALKKKQKVLKRFRQKLLSRLFLLLLLEMLA